MSLFPVKQDRLSPKVFTFFRKVVCLAVCLLFTFRIAFSQQLIFVDELERLPDSDPSATITAEVLPGSQGKILYGQIGNQVVRWVDGKPEQLNLPGRILETNADFSLIKGVITENQRYYVFKDGGLNYIDITLAPNYSNLNVVYFSDDGKLIIGSAAKSDGTYSRRRAIRVLEGSWQVLGDDPPLSEFGSSNVSAVRGENGSVIIGDQYFGGNSRGFRFENGTFQYFSSESLIYAKVASPNGKVIAGNLASSGLNNYVPYKWENGNLTVLGELETDLGYHHCTSVNNEGSIISGYAEVPPGPTYRGNMAFIWIEGRGLVKYNDYISNEYGIGLPGERIIRADISEDQSYILGTIGYANNYTRDFILLLNEEDERIVVNSIHDRPLNVDSSTECNTGQTVEINGREVPECTLRAAIQAAINRHFEDEGKPIDITFNIQGDGVRSISILSPLPEITAPISIDGTAHTSNFGLPLVSLDGAASAGSGLVLGHHDIIIKGFAVHGFSEHGIFINGLTGIELETLIVGTDANRTPEIGNGGDGIHILGDSKVKIGGLDRGLSPLETTSFGTNIAILGNAGRGLFIHNPANGTNERRKDDGIYQAIWEERNLRIKEEDKNIEVVNTTFGLLKAEDIEAYTDPNSQEAMSLLGANGVLIDNSSFWSESPSLSVASSEAVHVVQSTFGKNTATVSKTSHIMPILNRTSISSIELHASKKVTIGSYEAEDAPIEGIAAGSYFVNIEDSEDVEIHNVIVGAVKNAVMLPEGLEDLLNNLEGGIKVHNTQKVKIGRAGLPTVITNNGGKDASRGAGIHISGNLSQGIKIAGVQVGSVEGGVFGGNEGDGILIEDGVADFEIGGETEEEAVILAGNQGYGLVLSDINDNTIHARNIGKQVGKITNVFTDFINKANIENPDPNKSGGIKVSNAANVILQKLSIGQTDGNGIELTGTFTKNIKLIQSSIGSITGEITNSIEKIKGPKGDGIVISEASEIEIGDGSAEGEVKIWGSLSNGISILDATDIKISNSKVGAFDFTEFTSEFDDAAKKAGNAMGGIFISGSKRIDIFDTKISNNGEAPQSEFGGIMSRVSERISIHQSEIGNRTPSGKLFGNMHHAVIAENTQDITLSANKVSGNSGGIFGLMSSLNLYGNLIEEQKSEDGRLGSGISLSGGHLNAIRNTIKDNEDVGIGFSGVRGATVRLNNFLTNTLGGIRSENESNRIQDGGGLINAQENWWGDASGPSGIGPGTGNAVNGSVDFDNWLTGPTGVSVIPERNLVGLNSDENLELSVAFANHLVPSDRLNITVTDSLGWFQGAASFVVDVTEGVITSRQLAFYPSNSQSLTNKVTITAVSERDTGAEASAVIYLLAENRIVYLEEGHSAHDDMLDLERGNFKIGDELLFNNGGANEEKVVIKDFGSIILEEPLRYSHAAGENIILLNSTITSLGREMKNPESGKAVLKQNFPNPFSAKTTITYTLHTSEKIRLEIFDTLGRPLATLVEGVVLPGTHQVIWESGNHPAGIYYYKIEGIGFTETRKMILVRK